VYMIKTSSVCIQQISADEPVEPRNGQKTMTNKKSTLIQAETIIKCVNVKAYLLAVYFLFNRTTCHKAINDYILLLPDTVCSIHTLIISAI
jgi:superfamily II RNA helicase